MTRPDERVTIGLETTSNAGGSVGDYTVTHEDGRGYRGSFPDVINVLAKSWDLPPVYPEGVKVQAQARALSHHKATKRELAQVLEELCQAAPSLKGASVARVNERSFRLVFRGADNQRIRPDFQVSVSIPGGPCDG